LEIRDALLAMEVDINHECKKKVKISNLKVAWGLGVILGHMLELAYACS
jgi:hypothetical protein